MKIIFEAHSTTTDNEANLASGWNDVDLSELGVRQSIELMQRSLSRGLVAIVCSDSQRAVKSGIPTANALHIPMYPDQRLRECNYGDFTQKPKAEVEAQKLLRIAEPFPNGESYNQCIDRVKACIEWMKQTFEDNDTLMVIGSRATHYGLDSVINNGKPLEESIAEGFTWQPGWEYELG